MPRKAATEMVVTMQIFDYTEPLEPLPEPRYVVAYRESDRLLADAFNTDVPVVAWPIADFQPMQDAINKFARRMAWVQVYGTYPPEDV